MTSNEPLRPAGPSAARDVSMVVIFLVVGCAQNSCSLWSEQLGYFA